MQLKKDINKNNYDIVRIDAPANLGLDDNQVLERINAGAQNLPVEAPTKSVLQIILSNVFTYFNIIFMVLTFVLILAWSPINNFLFLGIIIINTVIGIVQELIAKKTLDKLNLLTAPKALVVRNGIETTISADELVLDDIVVFSSGSQICADADIVDGEVQVNESPVTGESVEVTKGIGESLLSGSFIVSGKCYAKLTAVGRNSFVSKLTIEAKKIKRKQQPGMMKSLTRLVLIIGILIIPMGIALFIQQMNVLGMSNGENIRSMTVALIGMIPEGLYLLTTVTLAVSVIRLAKKKILVHELKCIETLARVNVLCVDKTGTITEGNMQVGETVPLTGSLADADSVLRDFVNNMTADNDTMRALKKHFPSSGFRKALKVSSFSSVYKYSGVSFGETENYIIGAAEFITGEKYRNYKDTVEHYAELGNRVLMLAAYGSVPDGGELCGNVTPIALVLLSNNIRPAAKETFEYFRKQDVAVKVISGDNPITSSVAAKAAGIPGADKYIDAKELDTKEKLVASVTKYNVFGRVTPEQKKQLIIALKKAGNTVAMVGDGVNDVLALKEADCSISMASGIDAACQVSHLVLLNSDFGSMPSVVAEGRRVINNIQRSATLFLVKNIFFFALTLIAIFASFAYPVKLPQLSLVNAFAIGFPSFFLALEPNSNIIKGKFLRNVLFKAFPSALTNLFLILGVVLYAKAFKLPYEQSSTVCALLIGFVGMLTLIRVSSPLNLWRKLVLSVTVCLFTASIFVVGAFFDFSPLDLGGALILVTFMLLSFSVLWLASFLLDKISLAFGRLTGKLRQLR